MTEIKNSNIIPDFTVEELEERIEAVTIKPMGVDPNCISCCYAPCYYNNGSCPSGTH